MSNGVVHASVAESKLRDIRDRLDPEHNHKDADQVLVTLLRQLGYLDVVDLYEAIGLWHS